MSDAEALAAWVRWVAADDRLDDEICELNRHLAEFGVRVGPDDDDYCRRPEPVPGVCPKLIYLRPRGGAWELRVSGGESLQAPTLRALFGEMGPRICAYLEHRTQLAERLQRLLTACRSAS
jgi:hypothetical protein